VLFYAKNEFFFVKDFDADLSHFFGSYPNKVEFTFGFSTLMFMIFYSRDSLLQFRLTFYLLRLDLDEFRELKLVLRRMAFLWELSPAME
jgi:hypothetical protein